jgi:plastocyanin
MGRIVAVATAGLLGAAVAVLPGLAGAQSPGGHVTAADYSFNGDGTTPAALTVAPGAPVTFSYPAGYSRHDAHFSGAAPDSCTGSSAQVGSAPTPAGPGWSANCSFTAPGTYAFFCDVHPGMTGTITVAAVTPTPTTQATQSTPQPAPKPQNQPRVPAASHLLTSAVQRGNTVRAAVTIARGGSSLTARLLGPASLGRLSRRGLKAGTLHFSVALGAPARRTLQAKRRLRLTLEVTVVAPGGTSTRLTRTVLVRE